MGKVILYLMIVGVLFSCEKNNDANTRTELSGNWKLIQMTGSISDSETTGSEMEWQEYYLLRNDGTFLKSRDRDGAITEVSGKYRLIDSSNGKSLEFVFNGKSEIIGSCSPNLKEEMSFQSENRFSSTWQSCDGPGLIYEKMD